jgi:hypothetical protein
MKTPKRLFCISLIVLTITGFYSCKKENVSNGTGTIEFSLNLPAGSGQLKSANASGVIVSYQLMISVEDTKGNSVLSDKLVPLYTFGTNFVSDKVELKSGEFRLTKFMVIDPSGAVIYASPLAGSPLAYLATKPLPTTFKIIPDQNTPVPTQVLLVGTLSPSQFGYATFGVQIITPLDFYTYCILDKDNTLSGAPIVMTTAKLTISNNNDWKYTFTLTAAVNHLVIRGGSEKYTFLLEKEGYVAQQLTFTSQQLTAASNEKPLVLKILTGVPPVTQIMFFQPGPTTGKDAMISNIEPDKNFGDYKYFEATYMSEPMLTVMRSNRSLIFFDLSKLPKSAVIKKAVLNLKYDLPVPWDSTIFVSSNATTPKPYGVLQKIIEPWEENTVTWNKQPKTTETGQVFIQPFIKNSNVIEVDVTSLIAITATNTLPNCGLLFKLSSNEKFKGFRFASSDYPDSLMRPRLSVQYTSTK